MQFPVLQKVPSLQLIANTPPNDKHQREALQRQNRLQLAALLRATEEMLICAQQGDWESVEELEHARKQDLVVSFENNAHENSAVIVEALATLVYLNKQIFTLVKQAKQELVNSQQGLQQGKSAVQSYESHQDI
jgi:hypothetical protein